MKGKLVLVLFITCLFLLLFFPDNKTAYSGKYSCLGSTDETLILKPDNTFEIYCTFGKSEMEDNGKYYINDNNIELQYNHKNGTSFDKNISAGKVFGTEIIFTSSNGTCRIKFEKNSLL